MIRLTVMGLSPHFANQEQWLLYALLIHILSLNLLLNLSPNLSLNLSLFLCLLLLLGLEASVWRWRAAAGSRAAPFLGESRGHF